MKNIKHEDHKSFERWSLIGQNNGALTKKQRAQSLADKDQHLRQKSEAFAMHGNAPIRVKPFSVWGLPGNVTEVTKLKHSNGRSRYHQDRTGKITKQPIS